MDFDFNVIFEYFAEHFAEILLGCEMLLLRLVKKKNPEEKEIAVQEKKMRKLAKAQARLDKSFAEVKELTGEQENGGE